MPPWRRPTFSTESKLGRRPRADPQPNTCWFRGRRPQRTRKGVRNGEAIPHLFWFFGHPWPEPAGVSAPKGAGGVKFTPHDDVVVVVRNCRILLLISGL